ncbi:MAG: hypothetical protein ACR2O2_16135 [Ruegeria sp.]
MQRAEEAANNRPPPRTESLWQRLSYPVSFVGVFFLGVFAVFLTRYIQSQLVGVPDSGEASFQEIIGLGCASAAASIISLFLKDRQKEFASVSTIGVFLTTFTYHNLVWEYPDAFEQVYGPDWVEFTQERTEPSSLFLFGNVIKLT